MANEGQSGCSCINALVLDYVVKPESTISATSQQNRRILINSASASEHEETNAPVFNSASMHVLLSDVNALKNPDAHETHWGCAVVDPPTLVNFPGGHLVWAVQESPLALRMDVVVLKNPVAHVSH